MKMMNEEAEDEAEAGAETGYVVNELSSISTDSDGAEAAADATDVSGVEKTNSSFSA